MDHCIATFTVLLVLACVIPIRESILIEKELGTSKNIDVSNDKNYKLLPDLEKCGLAITTNVKKKMHRPKRMVGGKPASSTRFPWMAQLYLTNLTDANYSTNNLNCGGTFITNDVILTVCTIYRTWVVFQRNFSQAGHCVSRITTGTSFIAVGFGQSDRRKIKICGWEELKVGEKCSKRFSRRVDKFIIHEEYSEGNLQNDIALVFLDEPVRFSSRVRAICLPYSEELLKGWSSTKLKLAGWGMMAKIGSGFKGLSDVLLEVNTHVRERMYCNQFHTRQYGKLSGNRFCGGAETGSGSCLGDSGGPLFRKLPVPYLDGKERVFQFGIISSGTGSSQCGYQGRPLIFTNVLYQMPWILEKLGSRFSPESVESFSAERITENLESSSSEEFWAMAEIDKAKRLKNSTVNKFINEISTGLDIDVLSHPKLSKLASVTTCGIIPSKKNEGKDNDDFDDEVEVEYDDEESKENNNNRKKRMIGGRVAQMYLFPFLAQIYVRDAMTAEKELRCGGVIISNTTILTAASCVVELPSPWTLDSVTVGNYNRNKTKECFGNDSLECYEAKSYSLKSVVVHEDFEKFTFKNNIALLKIAGTMQFNRVVQPICIPLSEVLLNKMNDTTMISVGWGRVQRDSGEDETSSHSNILKYIEVILRSRSFCARSYTRFLHKIERDMLCGGGKSGEGECGGDLGGPLLTSIKIMEKGKLVNKYFQFGIISFEECGQQGVPTLYTNVLYFMPWILNNL